MLKTKTKTKVSAIFMLLLTICSILAVFPLNPINSDNEAGDTIGKDFEKLLLNNGIGEDPWWNASYQWRQCINISNPGSYNLTDNVIKVQFNWKNLYDAGHLQDDLDDIRIVENGILRSYYIKQDFPSTDLATVWFETNSTAGSIEYDTYLYYGNNTVGRAESYYMDHCPDGIARWEFEEGSGTMAYDSMSNKYHGTFVNMDDSNYVTGVQGDYALEFDGNNEFIALNMSINYQGAQGLDYYATTLIGPIYEFTASAWVKIGLNLGGWSILDFDRSEYFTFAAGTPGYGATDGHIEFDSSNLAGNIHDMNGNRTIDDDIPPVWHHCVVTFDYSLLNDKKTYVDGVFDKEEDAWSGLPIDDTVVRFGFIGDGSEASYFNGGRNGHYFEGFLDDVRYFDYALSDSEIEWLANYYPLDIELLDEVERAATVTIVVKDVDDRPVPGAEVSLWENSTNILKVNDIDYTQYTLTDGSVSFSRVPFGSYNITVNYTLNSGLYEEVVYDSRKMPGGDVEFKGLFISVNVTAELWAIDFEVEDWDEDPLDYGYVKVSNGTSEILETLTLDSAGEATFRWRNRTSYNYTIYYDNIDYTIEYPTSLNQSTIFRPITYEYVRLNMSKLDIQVMDSSGLEPITGVTVKVQINDTDEDVVELETDTSGYAYGDLTKDFGFWYLRQSYNFSLWIVNLQQTFTVNTSDKPKPSSYTNWYNYSLDHSSTLVFILDLNFTQRIANFRNATGDNMVVWGQNMSFSIVYETSNNSGQTWQGDWNFDGHPTSATWTIYTKYGVKILEKPMVQAPGGPTGNFTISVNSSLFSAGHTSEFYYALVTGYKPYWNHPEQVYFGFTIYAKPMGISLHDYTSMPDELPKNIAGDYEISEYYGRAINVTARIYDNDTYAVLTPETSSFEWDYGSGSLQPGPLPGYYTFEIVTSDAANVGKYRIDLTVTRENYSKIEGYGMYINILSRPTTINGSSGLLYVSEDIFIFEAINFTFEYIDVFSTNPILSLDEKSFLLQKIDAFGDPIPGTTETGDLIETVDNKYVLDLDTESRLDGEYSIIVTLDKLNYDHRIAIISLTVKKRVFQVQYSRDDTNYPLVDGTKFTVDSGARLYFTVTLTDPNNNSRPITNANVYLTFKGKDYYFDPDPVNPGVYSIEPLKIADAFFMPETFTATIIIERQYFSTNTTTITIVVNMHELFGIPTFYFLMIVGAVAAVVVALASYRIVQQHRIPTFVKKAKKMKSDIKGRKTISESLLYPSKEEYILKTLGDRWEALDLSLDDVLGLKVKKGKELPEVKGEFENLKGGVE